MKKWLVVLICFMLVLTMAGCSNKNTITTEDGTEVTIEMPDKIPKNFSEEFYRDMLVANELIQKSIDAKYNYLVEDFDVGMMKYFYPLNKEYELTNRDKEFIENNNIDVNKSFTYKEEHTAKLLWDICCNIGIYHANPDSETTKKKIEEQYKQFKTLLEIEEPK